MYVTVSSVLICPLFPSSGLFSFRSTIGFVRVVRFAADMGASAFLVVGYISHIVGEFDREQCFEGRDKFRLSISGFICTSLTISISLPAVCTGNTPSGPPCSDNDMGS